MSEWRRVRVKDVAEDVTVGFVGAMATEYMDSGVPFLRSLNVRPHRIDMRDVKYVGRDFHDKLRKSALRPGDVVTVRTGKPGQTAVVPSWLAEANCADLVVTRPGPNLDARWFSYHVNSIVTSHIAGHTVGAVQQHFNVRSVEAIELDLPSMEEQRAISGVLGALDDKIAADDEAVRRAENLMITRVGGACDRCAVASLVDQCTRIVSPALFAPTVSLFSLPAYDDGAESVVTSREDIKSSKFAIDGPAVLMSKLNPRIPRIWNISTAPDPVGVASTEFVVLEPRAVSTSVLWSVLSHPTVSADLAAKVAGTSGSHQRVKPADILGLEIPDPRHLSDRARDEIDALGRLVASARRSRSLLTVTRDELLSPLMLGRIRVRDADAVVEEVL